MILSATVDFFKLEPLPFQSNSLEPYIDQKTMEIHHDKHHGGYITNLNNAIISSNINMEGKSIEDLLIHAGDYSSVIRNNAGGHYNHDFFWKQLTPKGNQRPKGELSEYIIKCYGSLEEFKMLFEKEGLQRFGSGWVWLVVENGNLKIGSTPNQDNPLMDISSFKGIPILGVDVWEHAYYLKYQNRRAEYLSNIWNIINWDIVEKRFGKIM